MKPISFLLSLTLSISLMATGGTAVPDHGPWDRLLQKHVDDQGLVDYKALASSPAFDTYLLTLSGSHPDDSWSRDEQMAYWINVYNAYTVQLIIKNLPLASIKEIDMPWDKKFIEIEGSTYSLNQIEHEILRPEFKDARIHFAVNCASLGCPPLYNRAFLPTRLQNQLELVTRNFINDERYNQLNGDIASISKIFDWYASDFEREGGVAYFINKYAHSKLDRDVQLSYNDYDWSLNDQK
ncbi:MAG: DUF547 domain-containing protein [Flavobacteriales bacterium]|nr:DUF547 domain-containing protein [Flavobacteriales bacterium]